MLIFLDLVEHLKKNIAVVTTCQIGLVTINAVMIPSLLYGTEAITLNERQHKQITAVQTRHLTYLLGITW